MEKARTKHEEAVKAAKKARSVLHRLQVHRANYEGRQSSVRLNEARQLMKELTPAEKALLVQESV